MKTSLSSKGQIVLPAEIRQLDDLRPGQQFEVERLHDGEYVLRKILGPGQGGLVRWLMECPEKDWFKPMPSESTDEL